MKFITSKDCTQIASWLSGTGAPLLLVHGTTGDHCAWASTLAALEQHFSVWTMDRRGRGRSGDASSYALERECEDIATIVEAIGGNVHLLGHSYGGLCALEAALLTPNINKLILYEPSISLTGSGWSVALEERLQALRNADDREESLLLFFRDILKLSAQEIAAMQIGSNWITRLGTAHTILRELQSIDRYVFEPQKFQSIHIPTMLLVGGDSHPRRSVTAQMLQQSLSGSQIVILPGQQHSAMRTAPDLFVNQVIRFIKHNKI